MLERRREQAEEMFVRFVRGQQLVADLGNIIEGDARSKSEARSNCDRSNSQEFKLTSSRVSFCEYDKFTSDSRSRPDPKLFLGLRARLATPRSLPWSRVKKLTIKSPSRKG